MIGTMKEAPNMQLPTPVPTPPPVPKTAAVATPEIANRINVGTRKVHTELNRLIVERLPAALPPHATDPFKYAVGLSAFGQVFQLLEEGFRRVGERADEWDSDEDSEETWHTLSKLKFLAQLRPQGLPRVPSIARDLAYVEAVTGIRKDQLQSRHTLWDQDQLKDLFAQIDERPHTLVAYAWVMYMAIFSGGRWIRQQLANAGPEFWKSNELLVSERIYGTSHPYAGFTFLTFAGEHDGEDLKADFKTRLERVDDLFTEEEKDEVVTASQQVFALCVEKIRLLDMQFAEQQSRVASATVTSLTRSAISRGSVLWFGAILLILLLLLLRR